MIDCCNACRRYSYLLVRDALLAFRKVRFFFVGEDTDDDAVRELRCDLSSLAMAAEDGLLGATFCLDDPAEWLLAAVEDDNDAEDDDTSAVLGGDDDRDDGTCTAPASYTSSSSSSSSTSSPCCCCSSSSRRICPLPIPKSSLS